ncbi:MAG TPA: hypothetical protein VNT79_19345 [Phycisphaerae bacterium]|nr:hypothetical protein [Phycisphaerae bacterium]
MGGIGQAALRALSEKIRAIEQGPGAAPMIGDGLDDSSIKPVICTGWADVDGALEGGITAGGLHEWFGVEQVTNALTVNRAQNGNAKGRWTPPLCILVHLAWRAMDHNPSRPWTVWIGRKCHPYPRVLLRNRGNDERLLERSLFVSPREAAARVWTIDLALRSTAIGVVIADGSGFDMAATRRIQLLARDQSKWALLARPPDEKSKLSAAQTRWGVKSLPSGGQHKIGVKPRWSVELLRCKGVRPTGSSRTWLLEWNRAEGIVNLSAGLADPAGAAQEQTPGTESSIRQQQTA